MPHWQFGTPVIQLRVGDKTLSVPIEMFILNKVDVITIRIAESRICITYEHLSGPLTTLIHFDIKIVYHMGITR
jgi:hypothetical protein